MQDGANEPAAGPPARAETGPVDRGRAALWLGVGCGVGLALGVLLTTSVSTAVTFFTPVLPSDRNAVRVFHELNELRQQVNRLNAERALQDREKDEAMRQALGALTAAVRERDGGTPGAVAADKKPGGAGGKVRAGRPWDPLAELDEEIKRLEDTQMVLNAILDLFTPKGKGRATDGPGGQRPPE
jgi:hypothetical protein